MRFSAERCLFLALGTTASAQFPPRPEGTTTTYLNDGSSVSHKETFICEARARAWAGYVHLPAARLQEIQSADPYDASLFFWYFEARNDPHRAPTAIYLAGGPGEPGISGAVSDGGPCKVLRDANSTQINPWSWNNDVNMLYVDQPVGTGFSYTKEVKSTIDLLFLGDPITQTGIKPFEAYDGDVPEPNSTFLHGTFSEQHPQKTVNSTLSATKTLWHFTQVWLEGFSERRTENKGISLIGNSYGGYWASVTGECILKQNEKIAKGELASKTIQLNTVGWTNGCVDQLVQAEWYPEQASNNTYGLEVFPEAVYEQTLHNFTKPGGCRDLIQECRQLGEVYEAEMLYTNKTLNDFCVEAELYCATYVIGAYDSLSNRSDFDVGHLKPDPSPPGYWYGYLNQDWVQRALGVPINMTSASLLVNNVFLYSTGDPVRISGLKSVKYLLDHGVRIAMMYGDRDYRCPWNGCEKLSLAAQWSGAEAFGQAGYDFVRTNASYNGGMLRQHGNLSFSRVFDAGHDGLSRLPAPSPRVLTTDPTQAQAYQPETVSCLINRAIFGKDLATGDKAAYDDYSTVGPASSFHVKNELPELPNWECNEFTASTSCPVEQYLALKSGIAEIRDYVVVNPAGGSEGSLLLIL